MDALYYGQGLGGVIFDCLNNRDAEGNSLLAAVTGGVCPISLVRVVLKWGADVNSVNKRYAFNRATAKAVLSQNERREFDVNPRWPAGHIDRGRDLLPSVFSPRSVK